MSDEHDNPNYLLGDSTTETNNTDDYYGALYFADDGKPVPVELPASQPETIEELLLEHGIEPTDELIAALEDHTDSAAIKQAAGMICQMLAKLEGTAAAVALKWVVLGVGEDPMREQAEAIRVTHQAILKAAKLIRRKLGYQTPHI